MSNDQGVRALCDQIRQAAFDLFRKFVLRLLGFLW